MMAFVKIARSDAGAREMNCSEDAWTQVSRSPRVAALDEA